MPVTEDGANGGRVGILVGGGPAPGINGVIAGATREAIRNGLGAVGIYDGFRWLSRGVTENVVPLTHDMVEATRLRGGSILRTSRENPTRDPAMMARVVQSLRALNIRYLVTIGGDDTAYSASRTAREAGGAVRVAHVPKTIDNDLPLPGDMPTFGFQTARDVGGRLVRNLVEDARTTRRWYLVVAMGRTAGHLALGMGTFGGAAVTLIPEEFGDRAVTFGLLCDTLEGAIAKARANGQDHGVAVIAEGVGELLKEELKEHPLVVVENDEHGHLRLAEVPLALIFKRILQDHAKARGKKRTFVDVTIGYELRCADPIPFDVDYTQQLGWGALRYLLQLGEESWHDTGALISLQAGEVVPIPFDNILDPRTNRTAIRRVNVTSDRYRSLRAAMTRLERADFEDAARLEAIAAAAGLSAEEFRGSYARVVGL